MKLPFVSRKKYDELGKTFKEFVSTSELARRMRESGKKSCNTGCKASKCAKVKK